MGMVVILFLALVGAELLYDKLCDQVNALLKKPKTVPDIERLHPASWWEHSLDTSSQTVRQSDSQTVRQSSREGVEEEEEEKEEEWKEKDKDTRFPSPDNIFLK